MKEIIIDVTTSGDVTVHAKGFKGKSCAEATEPYEKVLGIAGKRKWKPSALIQQQEVGNRGSYKQRY